MAGISKKRIKTKTGEKVKYTITYYDVFGKRHTSGYYDTIKEAKRDLKNFETPKKVNNITYGFIFNSFLEKVKIKNSSGTYNNYKLTQEKYFKSYLNFEYEKINSLHWQKFFDEIEINISPHVARYCLKFAKAAVNWQIKHDNIQFNIFNKIEPIKLPQADINHLTIEELKNVLECCKKCYKEYYPLLFTFIGTGAREGEILALEKTDINLKENYISISKQFTKGKLINHPKTASSNRKIYIFENLKNVLFEYVKTLKPDCSLLFPNRAGKYLNAENLRERFWKKLLKLCGITKRVRLHDLRGSYIDMVLSSGLSVKFAQNQAGHSKSDTTLNVYAQNNSDMIQSAMNQLNCIFGKYQQNGIQKENKEIKNIIQFPKRCINKDI